MRIKLNLYGEWVTGALVIVFWRNKSNISTLLNFIYQRTNPLFFVQYISLATKAVISYIKIIFLNSNTIQ